MFLSHFNFLYFCEIRWNRYLPQNDRCPCVRALLCSLLCPAGLLGRAGPEVILGCPLPPGRAGSRWSGAAGLESEGLEPVPGWSRGFSSAQWLFQPYQGWHWVPWGWSRISVGVGFSWVWWQSLLWFGMWLRPEGLQWPFCTGFTFSPVCTPWLEGGSGPERLGPHHWAGPTLSGVHRKVSSGDGRPCPGAGAVPCRVCAGTLAGRDCRPPSQRQGRTQASATFSHGVHAHWQWGPPPEWGAAPEHGGREQEPGGVRGVPLSQPCQPTGAPGSVQPTVSLPWRGVSGSLHRLFKSSGSVSYSAPASSLVFTPDEGAPRPGAEPRAWVPDTCFRPGHKAWVVVRAGAPLWHHAVWAQMPTAPAVCGWWGALQGAAVRLSGTDRWGLLWSFLIKIV